MRDIATPTNYVTMTWRDRMGRSRRRHDIKSGKWSYIYKTKRRRVQTNTRNPLTQP